MKTNKLNLAIALTLGAAMVTSVAVAKGKPAVELGNNLSFAAKFVPNTTGAPVLRAACDPTPTLPAGPECASFPGYYCQKTAAVWQAACQSAAADTLDVTATWGANLLGDAPLKAGRPIRVEMVLTESGGTAGPGYVVTNLTPELEDRLATYGTNGTVQNTNYTVWDSGALLKIERCDDQACAAPTATILPEGLVSAELNSLGNIVYGYNWGTKGKASAPGAGIYKLTFTANGTTITSAPGAQVCAEGSNCTYVIITVTQAAGGGGGKPK